MYMCTKNLFHLLKIIAVLSINHILCKSSSHLFIFTKLLSSKFVKLGLTAYKGKNDSSTLATVFHLIQNGDERWSMGTLNQWWVVHVRVRCNVTPRTLKKWLTLSIYRILPLISPFGLCFFILFLVYFNHNLFYDFQNSEYHSPFLTYAFKFYASMPHLCALLSVCAYVMQHCFLECAVCLTYPNANLTPRLRKAL